MRKNLSFFAIAFTIIVLMAFKSNPSSENKGIARVQKILGKEVYVLAEPLRDYEIVDKKTTSMTSNLSGRQSIQKQMQEVISRQLKEVEKGKSQDFDGVLTDDGDVIVIIKFK